MSEKYAVSVSVDTHWEDDEYKKYMVARARHELVYKILEVAGPGKYWVIRYDEYPPTEGQIEFLEQVRLGIEKGYEGFSPTYDIRLNVQQAEELSVVIPTYEDMSTVNLSQTAIQELKRRIKRGLKQWKMKLGQSTNTA